MPPKRKASKPLSTWSRSMKKYKKIGQVYANRLQLTRPLSYERKWIQTGYSPIQMTPANPMAINPLYYIAQGVQQDQRVGLTIQDVNMYVTFKYTSWGTSSLTAGKFGSTCIRMIAFANPATWRQTVSNTPESNAAGTGTVISIGNVFLDSGVDRCTQSYLNKDINKVLYDTGCIATPPASNQTQSAPNSINGGTICKRFKLKLGDLRYTSNGNSYLRDDNLYLWAVADALGVTGTASNDIMGEWSMNILITFKDS